MSILDRSIYKWMSIHYRQSYFLEILKKHANVHCLSLLVYKHVSISAYSSKCTCGNDITGMVKSGFKKLITVTFC